MIRKGVKMPFEITKYLVFICEYLWLNFLKIICPIT